MPKKQLTQTEKARKAKYLREWRARNKERARIISLRWYYKNRPDLIEMYRHPLGTGEYKYEDPTEWADYKSTAFPFPDLTLRLLTLKNSSASTLEMLAPTKISRVPNIKDIPNLPAIDGMRSFVFLGFSSF